jgi:3-hydroxyisobutyrate dehydrogenase-like beta-hydroxyacid dehydrogenase
VQPREHIAYAGDQALFEAAAGPLDVMGKASFFLGEVGAGANMKLVVNAVMGSMMAAFAEGMSLADRVSDSLHQRRVMRRNLQLDNSCARTSSVASCGNAGVVWAYGSGWCPRAGLLPT